MTPFQRIFWIFALAAVWSPSYLFMKLALNDLSPVMISFLRIFMGALMLSGILYLKKINLPSKLTFWIHSFVMGLFSTVLPYVFFCVSECSIDSALAAVLMGCTPIFTAILSQLFLPSDALNRQKAMGILVSFAGLVVLFYPSIKHGMSESLLGMSFAVLATFSIAISHIYGKKFMTHQVPYLGPSAQMIAASTILFPIVLLTDTFATLNHASMTTFWSVAALGFLGTFLAFIIYYKLLEACGPTAISTVACVIPVIGMFLGVLFLGEAFTNESLIATCLILFGLILVNEIRLLSKEVYLTPAS